MNVDNIKVPNFFYDLIVFMTPSASLLIGIFWGLGISNSKNIIVNSGISNVEGFDFLMVFIIVFIFFLFLAYEYGRLVEVLSTWISSLVKFLRQKKICFKKEKDFSICFKKEIEKLKLDKYLDDDRMDKWTIYFYAMRFQPSIGSDILKRYAWEKLSRSSAFTFGVLFVVSLLLSVPRIFCIKSFLGYCFLDTGLFGFGSFAYTLTMLFFTIITVYEFYRRRCWNNDLLIKIIPVIMLSDDFKINISSQKKKNS